MKTNYHTHCRFCDGKGEPRDYVLEGIKRGFTTLGFSSHAPLKEINDWTLKDSDVDDYLKTINSLKIEFKDQITIYTGMEIDYYPDENRFDTFKKYNLDYSIGSVHMLKPAGHVKYYSVDESEAVFTDVLNKVFGTIEAFTREYYKIVRALIIQGGFDILGHIDLIKKFNKGNKFFLESEPWYIEEVINTLDTLKGRDIIVEMNTGALSRGIQDTPYPSEWILEECFKRDIKICLNSDVHAANNIECYFDESLEIIKRCGYKVLHTPFETIKLRS